MKFLVAFIFITNLKFTARKFTKKPNEKYLKFVTLLFRAKVL